MRSVPRPYLSTVVMFEANDQNGNRFWAGTGFCCLARHWNDATREFRILATNAHVVDRGFERIHVSFPPTGGAAVKPFTVTGKIDGGRATWKVDRKQDLAVLLLEGEHPPLDQIRPRSFDVEAGALSLWQLWEQGVGLGDEAFLVGFVLPREARHRKFLGVRLASISRLPRWVTRRKPFILEGTAFPGNSGSPVILSPGQTAGGNHDGGAGGKLIGIVRAADSPPTVLRSDERGVPAEVRENAGQIHIVPVDVLREWVDRAIMDVIFDEKVKRKLPRFWGWLRGRRHATWRLAITRAVPTVLADALRPSDPGPEAACDAEIRCRITAIEAGTENLEPWEKVPRRIERKIRNR